MKTKTYWFGPMSLEEYVEKEGEIHELFQYFSDTNPNMDVTTNMTTTDYRDTFFIKIIIDECEDNS